MISRVLWCPSSRFTSLPVDVALSSDSVRIQIHIPQVLKWFSPERPILKNGYNTGSHFTNLCARHKHNRASEFLQGLKVLRKKSLQQRATCAANTVCEQAIKIDVLAVFCNEKSTVHYIDFWRGLWTWPPWVIFAPAYNHKPKRFCIYLGFLKSFSLRNLTSWRKN